MTGPFWTQELTDEMCRLLTEEGLSCSQVAACIGCSRNAVIGKVHRIEHAQGIRLTREKPRVRAAKPSSPLEGYKAKRPYLRRVPAPSLANDTGGFMMPVVPVAAPQPIAEPDLSKACGLVDLKGCKWPVSFDAEVIGGHIFCNEETCNGVYCSTHQAASVAVYSTDLIRRTVKSVHHTLKRFAA